VRYKLALAAAVSVCLARASLATVWDVSSISQFKSALISVQPGDEIRITYGVYSVRRTDDAKHWFKTSGTVAQPIRIIGQFGPNGERPVFDADVPVGGLASDYAVERGLFYLWTYNNNYVFENLEIRNCRGRNYYSNNAAAAYILGSNITFRNCYSHHNDNGWFAASSASNTVLEFCETAYNGKLPGASGDMTHNHYMASQLLTVRGCYIHDSTEGQNFKSRCRSVIFEYNWVENAASYEWELASGNAGNSVMIGNVIIKNPNSGNRRIIGLSDGTATDATSGVLTMINNTIVLTNPSVRCFFSTSVATTNVVLYNNAFVGSSTLAFDPTYWSGSGTFSGSNNWFWTGTTVPAGPTDSLFGTNPGVVDLAGKDYRLVETSPLRNAGMNSPQWLNSSGVWEGRVPSLEYNKHARTSGRSNNANLDIGAYEFLFAGDITRDGKVNVFDLQRLGLGWNKQQGQAGYDPACDLTGDNRVNVFDLQVLAGNWNKQ